MASSLGEASSSSSMARSCTYKVFLSFRGEDTRKGFTSHLYAALVKRGITTYIDDKNLRKGNAISKELLKAIEESMFAVVILSPNYASSTWCLEELCKILECKNKLGLEMEIVFCGVQPCDVRYQIGAFKKAFEKHETRQKREDVKRWKEALQQVAAHSGWTPTQFQNDAILVESIAQHIHERLIKKTPPSDDLVGIAAKLEEVVGHIGIGVNDVRFIGIWGIGGVGKTTIARRVFKTIQSEFEASCFLANVRARTENGGIVQIQKQLLDRMNSNTTFYDEFEGKDLICDSVCNKKVLLVLDDVDDVIQLQNLAGAHNWFGPGSRIIITTRDRRVLDAHEVENNRICEVKGLKEKEAHELFCLKAFRRPEPKEGYMDLSKEVVEYCDGLPLALEVLGSHLYGRPIDIWRKAIEKIKSSPDNKIFTTLKISYNGLDDLEKDIFLDIACFFKGCERGYATNILKMCGYHAEIGIVALTEKSLLTIINDDFCGDMLGMHDLLEEMGKQIVIQEFPSDPSKRSRLWSKEDACHVLTQNKEIDATDSIFRRKMFDKVCWSEKLAILYEVEDCTLDKIPCSLRVLHWTYCPMETLPLIDKHYKLVEICIHWSSIVHVWHGKKFLDKLKYLNLSRCWFLEQMPDISGAPNLKALNLKGCSVLNYIHPSLAHHKSLIMLNLEECTSLETLGDELEMTSLKYLFLCKCTSLRRLPEFRECMSQLSILTLGGTYIEELPKTFGNLVGLTHLNLSNCNFLNSLAFSPGDFSVTSSLESTLDYDFGRFALLRVLDLSNNSFLRVPIIIHELPMLTHLNLRNCYELKYLPKLPSSLRELDASNCISLHSWSISDVISKACCAFAESTKQDGEDVLQIMIPGKEIPSWFDHQEEGDTVSVSFLHNCPSTKTMALALCFLLERNMIKVQGQPVLICNGKELVNQSLFEVSFHFTLHHLLIVCLNRYHFSNLLSCEPNFIQMLFYDNIFRNYEDLVKRCGARWVCEQDGSLLPLHSDNTSTSEMS